MIEALYELKHLSVEINRYIPQHFRSRDPVRAQEDHVWGFGTAAAIPSGWSAEPRLVVGKPFPGLLANLLVCDLVWIGDRAVRAIHLAVIPTNPAQDLQ